MSNSTCPALLWNQVNGCLPVRVVLPLDEDPSASVERAAAGLQDGCGDLCDVDCWELLVKVLAACALRSRDCHLVDPPRRHGPGLNAAEAVAELASKAAVTVRRVFHVKRIDRAEAIHVGGHSVATVGLVGTDLALV